MSTEQEAQRDLSLDTDAAEEVVGGRSVTRRTKKTAHNLTSPKIITVPPGSTTPWEPDPTDPGLETDTGDPTA